MHRYRFRSLSIHILLILVCNSFNFLIADNVKHSLKNSIDAHANHYIDIAQQIWEVAEMGYLEFESSKILIDKAREEGFRIQNGVADIPTAFVATYGSGRPVIGIMAEFDALPGLSQKAVTE